MLRFSLDSRIRREKGFSLIEIAVVLVIASLLIAAGIGMTTAIIDSARVRATRQNMEAVKLALQGFASRNGRLPCPAVEGLAQSNANFGIEDTRTSNPATSCANTVNLAGAVGIDVAKRGVVPWKTLGLTIDSAADGWGNQMTYYVSVTSTTVSFDTVPGIRGSLYVHSSTPVAAGLPGPPANGNQINACSTTANDNSCNKAAVVVVISHGRNASGAYTFSGLRLPLPTDAGEAENTNDDRSVVAAEPSPTYDDILLPLAPYDLLGPLAAQGAIKIERAIMQDLARQVVTQMIGEVVPTRADSGVGVGSCNSNACRYTLPAPSGATSSFTFAAGKFNASCDFPYNTTGVAVGTVSDVTGDAAQVLDPWGQFFKFGRATQYINSTESCSTPVAIISLGADKTLGTADDYVYYSPMAEWKEILGKVGW